MRDGVLGACSLSGRVGNAPRRSGERGGNAMARSGHARERQRRQCSADREECEGEKGEMAEREGAGARAPVVKRSAASTLPRPDMLASAINRDGGKREKEAQGERGGVAGCQVGQGGGREACGGHQARSGRAQQHRGGTGAGSKVRQATPCAARARAGCGKQQRREGKERGWLAGPWDHWQGGGRHWEEKQPGEKWEGGKKITGDSVAHWIGFPPSFAAPIRVKSKKR